MNKSDSLYVEAASFFHKLDGSVKFVMMIAWTIFIFMFMDIRIFLIMLFAGFLMLKISKVPWKNIKPLVLFIVIFTIFNSAFLLIVSPDYGSQLAHKITPAIVLGGYKITYETLFYALTLSIKYLSILPITLLFLFTTNPSRFASSLNRIGIPYKVSYTVSIALRYVPDVKDEVRLIIDAQEARGVSFEKGEASVIKRLKNYTTILIPLLMSSLSRIDTVSNAMDLRGFGRYDKRTWYSRQPISSYDISFLILSALLIIAGVMLKHFTTNYFWYPF